jgi:hypothetical protein
VPEWVVPAAFVALFLAAWIGVAWRNTREQISRTLKRRANPTREAFFAMMTADVSPDATEFLWDTALLYLRPKLTPHPDDDLVADLPIDGDDWSMDWPRDFARRHGFDEKFYPIWPEGWPVTVRNFGQWLDMGRARASD